MPYNGHSPLRQYDKALHEKPNIQWIEGKVAFRDGYTCQYCGAKGKLGFDHIVPRSRGGLDSEENLTQCCLHCNLTKAKKLLREWKYPFDNLPAELPFFLQGPKLFWRHQNEDGHLIDELVILHSFQRPTEASGIVARVRRDTGWVESALLHDLNPIDKDRFQEQYQQFCKEEVWDCMTIIEHTSEMLMQLEEYLQALLKGNQPKCTGMLASIIQSHAELAQVVREEYWNANERRER